MIDNNLNQIFNGLRGHWIIERQVSGRDGRGTMIGDAVFTSVSHNRLLAEEKGIFTMNGTDNEVYRSYIYELQDDRILILYNDPHRKGDILHELFFEENALGECEASHCHVCGQDTYDVSFKVLPNRRTEIHYMVKGPNKEYSTLSILTQTPT